MSVREQLGFLCPARALLLPVLAESRNRQPTESPAVGSSGLISVCRGPGPHQPSLPSKRGAHSWAAMIPFAERANALAPTFSGKFCY